MSGQDVLNAAEAGDASRLRELIAEKAPLEYKDKDGRTALHRSVANEHVECVELLLLAGADKEASCEKGITPLMQAVCYNGSSRILDLLLKAGARIDARTVRRRATALHIAALLEQWQPTLSILLDAGADVDARDKDGITPLMIAAGHSEYSKNSACTPMVNELLVRGADWDALDKRGWGALHAALGRRSASAVKALLDAGACAADVCTRDGTSSLEVATDEQCREAVLARGYSEEGKKVRANPHVVACGLREQYEGGDPVLLDVTLQAEGAQGTAPAPACFGESIRVHGGVMAAQGEFWRTLIAGHMARPDRTYALTDITAAQLRLLTDFSYSGRLPRHATAPVLLQALRLAHRYQMQHCLETVVARLKATMELENESVFAIYSAALDLNVKPLVEAVEKKACAEEAHAWWAELIADDERWRKLRQETSGADELLRVFMRSKVGVPPAATAAAAGEKRKRGGE